MADKKVGRLVAAGLAAGGVLWLIARGAKGVPEFICPYCDEVFETYEELETHVLLFHEQETVPPPPEPEPEPEPELYECPYCSAVFYTQEDLAAHIEFYHPPEPEPEPEPEPIEFSVSVRKSMYPTIDPYTVCETWFDVTNSGAGPGVQVLHVWDSVGNVDQYIEVTLNPGGTYTWHRVQWIDFSRISIYKVEAEVGYFDTHDRWIRKDYSKVTFP